MVKTSGEDKSLTEFAIINKNTLSQSARGTYVKTVTIKFPGHEIVIIQQDRNKVIVSKTNHFIYLPILSLKWYGMNFIRHSERYCIGESG